jgi:hypothetical protein
VLECNRSRRGRIILVEISVTLMSLYLCATVYEGRVLLCTRQAEEAVEKLDEVVKLLRVVSCPMLTAVVSEQVFCKCQQLQLIVT